MAQSIGDHVLEAGDRLVPSARPAHSVLRQVYGVALHDAYHTGQIQYVKKLLRSRRAR